MVHSFGANRKWIGIVLAVVLLVAGAALVAAAAEPAPATGQAVKPEGTAAPQQPLSPGMEETLKALRNLGRDYAEKLHADATALIEKAVTDGKITRAEADRLLAHKVGKPGAWHGKKMPHKGGEKLHFKRPLTAEALKAKLDAAVKAGKLTQEQADLMLKKWENARAKVKPEQTN